MFRLPQGMFLDFIFLGMIAIAMIKGININYKNKYLGWFLAYLFLHFMVKWFIPMGLEFKQIGRILAMQQLWILEPMIHIFLATFVTVLVMNFTKEDFVKIAKALCLSGVLVAAFSLLQFVELDPLQSIVKYGCANHISACLDNPNVVGNFLALCSPFYFIFFKDKKYIIGFLLTVLGICITMSNFAYCCFAFGAGIFILSRLINRSKMLDIFILLFLGIGFIITFCYVLNHLDWLIKSGMGRFECWKLAFDKFKGNTLFGYGTASFKNYKMYIDSTCWLEIHNDWLSGLHDLGFVGMGLFSVLIYQTLKKFKPMDLVGFSYFACFMTFLFMMTASFPIEVPSLAIIGLIGFWGVEKNWRENGK
jgi:hypothetical protein